jgi:hypothetical protein
MKLRPIHRSFIAVMGCGSKLPAPIPCPQRREHRTLVAKLSTSTKTIREKCLNRFATKSQNLAAFFRVQITRSCKGTRKPMIQRTFDYLRTSCCSMNNVAKMKYPRSNIE